VVGKLGAGNSVEENSSLSLIPNWGLGLGLGLSLCWNRSELGGLFFFGYKLQQGLGLALVRESLLQVLHKIQKALL
jgi:hypothetical protein